MRLEVTSGNLAENRKTFRKTSENYEFATCRNANDMKYRIASFLTCIGPHTMQIHNGLTLSEDDYNVLNKIIDRLQNIELGYLMQYTSNNICNKYDQLRIRIL